MAKSKRSEKKCSSCLAVSRGEKLSVKPAPHPHSAKDVAQRRSCAAQVAVLILERR